MLRFAIISIILLLVVLAISWVIGRTRIGAAINENDADAKLVGVFHADLVTYANSDGKNWDSYATLTMNCTSVEAALGSDNYVSGVTVGFYSLQGAPLLPLALQEMRRLFGDSLWNNNGRATAEVVQTTLIRHLGRRKRLYEDLNRKSHSISACMSWGWATFAALPLSALKVFGVLTTRRVQSAKRSIIFRLWSFLLATATVLGPVIAYLADQKQVDATIKAFFVGHV
jgi:hypothetical protein